MISETEIKQQIGEFIKKRINVNMCHPNHSGDASHAYKIIYTECQFTDEFLYSQRKTLYGIHEQK